ncbi:MAG: class I SAM-dependent methyltransferase [Desulfarculales bacterium]|jgi:ubiquinone/menaquinone biosynthesis C-methylase UbiE|nr:class I SAM-dependent methyltransferase [Desulfarculales bacterium]
MDKIFAGIKPDFYQQWLECPSGRNYLRASNLLIDNLLNFRPNWRVLDIGCGSGSHLQHLAGHRLQTFGLEASPVMLDMARQRLGARAEITSGDALSLPYEDNSFDAVLMINTLEYLERPGLALAEAIRVCSGFICIIGFNPWSLNSLLMPAPLRPLRSFNLWQTRALVRQLLGPAPQSSGSASLTGRPLISRLPFMGLIGVCAPVTPRFMTTPLTLEVDAGVKLAGARGAGSLRVVKFLRRTPGR